MASFERTRLLTPRLELIAATPEFIQAELKNPVALGAVLGAAIDGDWPPGEYDRNAQEFFLARLNEEGAAAAGWYSWYALSRNTDAGRAMVGAGGYCGPPDEQGEVEIGFSMLPGFRCRGFATEMAAALAVNALAEPKVLSIVGHADVENVASQRVLRKCFFRHRGREEETGQERFVLARRDNRHSALQLLMNLF